MTSARQPSCTHGFDTQWLALAHHIALLRRTTRIGSAHMDFSPGKSVRCSRTGPSAALSLGLSAAFDRSAWLVGALTLLEQASATVCHRSSGKVAEPMAR